MLRELLASAEQATAAVWTAARAGTGRSRWSENGRTYIALKGGQLPGGTDQAEDVRDQVRHLPGVRWAELNAALSCVVISHEPELIGTSELVTAIEEAEASAGLDTARFAEASTVHPASPGRTLGHAMVIGANLAGLGYAAVTRALPIPALPESIPSMLTTADAAPKIRETVQTRLGHTATDLLFGVGSAAAHTFAQQPTSLIMESAIRLSFLRETRASQRSWARWNQEAGDPESHRCPPQVSSSRPGALPAGPIERAGNRSALAAPAAFAGALGTTRSFQRAQGFLVAAAPRAAHLGRDAFAAQLGHELSEKDTLVLDPEVLRKLDRIDTVVIDAAALSTGNQIVQDVFPLNGDADSAELWQRADDLTEPGSGTGAEHDGWSLEPLRERSRWPNSLRNRLREETGQGARIHALHHGGQSVAVIVIVDQLEPLTGELLAAARAVGPVVLAGAERMAERLGVERTLPGGTRLATSVRELQAEGNGVAVVSPHQGDGLAAADIGLGSARDRQAPPWGAHVFCGPGLGGCCGLLRLIPDARQVSRRSAQLAVGASLAGGLLAMLGPPGASQQRAGVPIAAAAVIALGAGTWWGTQAARRPVPRAAPRTPWHNMSSAKALEVLGSSPEGLAEDEVQRRAEEQAELPDQKRVGLMRATIEELDSPLTPALVGGAGISASIGAVTDAVVIGGVLGMNALIGGIQRMKADQALGRLLESSAVLVTVRRKGQQAEATADDLVPGDVIELLAGDAVPADCRLLEAEGLEADESSLTGESQLVSKSGGATPAAALADRRSMLYQGTAIAAGRAVAVVVATGPDTEARRSLSIADGPARTGGVAARLQSLAKATMPLCIGSGVLLLAVDLVRRQPIGIAVGRAVSLAVAAVPEGLPFVATVAELAAAQRLSKRGALVHNSSTIEALGRAQVLCFDKTGTLTEGKISLRQVSDGATSLPVDALGDSQRGVLGAALRASPAGENGETLPHPTDRAVVEGAYAVGVFPDEGMPGWQRLEELPFEPSRSYHAVLGGTPRGQLLSVKGAPEIMLSRCTHWQRDDTAVELDEDTRESFMGQMEQLARKGFRVLAVAERPASDRRDLDESRIRELHLTGMLALADTVRPTAAESVAQLQQAGVGVAMVTGDHPSTAEAIAADLGVLNGQRVLTGPDLDSLDDERLSKVIGDIAVFARVTPEQKARIVRALQSAGRVTAVTGDGANDAPAIRLADIGIALGEQATPAAREAADLVVTDDRIETIVDAIVEGRAMWASVRDSLAILLGGNLGEIGYTVLTGLLSSQGGMNARQLLLVNVLTDVLPAMAIAVRPPPRITAEMLLAEGPEASLGTALTRDIYRRGAITAGAATAAWSLGRMTGTARQAGTAALVALIGAQLGQTLLIRGRTPLVVGSALASMVVLAVAVQTPGLSRFFGSTPLWPHGWAIALGASASATLASVLFQ